MTLWLYGLLAASVISLTSCIQTSAQIAGDHGEWTSTVGPELATLYNDYSAYVASRSPGEFRPTDPLVRVVENRVVIDAVASTDANLLKSDLESLGMRGAVAFGRVVSGQLPISAILAMAVLPSLKFARASSGPVQRGQESGVRNP